ncbi:hypothetical protein [Cutibacterium sp.]|uniref:hypothetical protein n=1 Tax=Cutibacterium sp. TaxID=1912221 RepID=UPI0026DCD5CF|nr:hypothetical protein [Cutibacterium sp.]MDO4412453.1 hypothetical protein [Cutibacterium sp.]
MTKNSDWQPGVVFTDTLSLTLDDEAQEVLRGIRNQLVATAIPVLHEPAHITVAAVSTMNGVDSDLVDVGWPERVTLTTACQLPNSDNVVALCPHDSHRSRSACSEPTACDSTTIFDTSQEVGAKSCSALAQGDGFCTSRIPEALRCPHERLHRRLAAVGVTTFNYYGPRWWNPHVTMGYQVPLELQRRAVEILANVVPLEVGVTGVSVWHVADGQTYLLYP